MKKMCEYTRIIVMILMFFQILSVFTPISFAEEGTGILDTIKVTDGYTNDIELKVIINGPISNADTPIRVSFDNTDVLDYSIETDGLIATEVGNGSMEYDIVATDEFGTLDVYATYEDDVVVKRSIHTYKRANRVYVSDVSKDQAWYNWIEELVELGELALNEAQELYYELCAEYVEEYAPTAEETLAETSIADKTVVQGKLFWQESETEIAPLIRVKVQLIKKTNGITQIIDSQYSGVDGSYKFVINNSDWNDSGEDIFIRWWLEAKTFKVTNNWIVDHYCFQGSLKENITEGSVEALYYMIPYDTSTNHYKATYVHQAMGIAERFAIDMGMNVPNYDSTSETRTKLNVAYPSWLVTQGSAYCFGHDVQSVASIGKSNWQDVDAITHEYGHYVQYLLDIYGANLLEIVCNNPEHHPLADYFSEKWEKEYAMELTWSEAWASTFSTLSEHYYWYRTEREYWYFDDNVSSVISMKSGAMSNNSFLGWDLETPHNSSYNHDGDVSTPTKDNRGEAQEATINAFLWDLYDDYSSLETFDEVNLGYNLWWYYTTKSGIYTLEDFTQRMYNDRPDLRDKIGKIMSFYKIAPEIKSVSACNKNTPPIITFDTNGSQDHPNNVFEILFYDESGNLLGQTGQIEVKNTSRIEYTASDLDNVWGFVLDELNYSCDQTYKIYVAVAGYYDDDSLLVGNSTRRLSGPYISSYAEIVLPIEHSFEYQQINSTSHKLICSGCGGEETILNHNFKYVNLTNTHHTKKCTDCGYSVTSSHNFVYSSTDEYHILTCSQCGMTSGGQQSHSWTTVNDGNLLIGKSVKCEICGHRKILGFDDEIIIIKGKKPEFDEETE